jgi:hypothetical protein
MCEVLIMTHDHHHIDPEKDARGCWKKGMTITVQDDGWEWTKTEAESYEVVKFPGLPKEKIDYLLWEDFVNPLDPSRGILGRRRFRFDLDKLTLSFKFATIDSETLGVDPVSIIDSVILDATKCRLSS